VTGLRPYQIDVTVDVDRAIATGRKRPIVSCRPAPARRW
jgi:hypothetical protein